MTHTLPVRLGLRENLGQFTGYLAVAAAAFATGWVAARAGLRPEPFYLGVGFVAAGLLLSLFVRDTSPHARLELFPLVFAAQGMSVTQIGVLAALYPGTWGVLLGIGTAMVYPTLLAVIGDVASPAWRASALGSYRLWRDLGYAAGALLAGAVADLLSLGGAMWVVAALTVGSGTVVALRVCETRPQLTV